MASGREMRLRIASVKNISQVTRALSAVSASKVRKSMAAVAATRNYATKAWQVLTHIAGQPGRNSLHPLLTVRPEPKNALVVMLSGDRGLAGPYNTNVLRFTLENFDRYPIPVRYVAVGRKGSELLFRRGKDMVAHFEDLPAQPTYGDVSAIGRLVVDEFLSGETDEVHLVYTDFVNMMRQDPSMKKLLPLEFRTHVGLVQEEYGRPGEPKGPAAAYIYEPGQTEILDEII